MRGLLTRIRRIAIGDCVHYCGFPYGRNAFNPYENFITGLSRGMDVEALKASFVEFLRFYRPADLGTALGVITRSPVPLWWLPWKSWRKLWKREGWHDTPAEVIDVMTQFSSIGIPRSLVEHEFHWLQRAWDSIRQKGYRPTEHAYIQVHELRHASSSRYIVIDGNHRLSALAALGYSEVEVMQHRLAVTSRHHVRLWPLVLSGHVHPGDALAIFDAYFIGNDRPCRSAIPAELV